MTPRRDDLVVTRWGARFQGRRYRCAIGKGGIGIKRGEGDNITPLGVHRLLAVAYRPDRTSVAGRGVFVARPIGLQDKWSDDPSDPAYNQPVRAQRYAFSHERLRRADRLYDLVGVLDFNHPVAVPGAGSAIFLHVWRRERFPTAGCIAFAPQDLRDILNRWTPHSRVIVR